MGRGWAWDVGRITKEDGVLWGGKVVKKLLLRISQHLGSEINSMAELS